MVFKCLCSILPWVKNLHFAQMHKCTSNTFGPNTVSHYINSNTKINFPHNFAGNTKKKRCASCRRCHSNGTCGLGTWPIPTTQILCHDQIEHTLNESVSSESHINLSTVFGSYNFKCLISTYVPMGDVVVFLLLVCCFTLPNGSPQSLRHALTLEEWS